MLGFTRFLYCAWLETDGSVSLTTKGANKGSKLLYTVAAASHEEAMAIHHLRQGLQPYTPAGKAQRCPKGCRTHYYPEGSGVCPMCGLGSEAYGEAGSESGEEADKNAN